MPVVPAPPEDEIPRIVIAFVPEVSICTPGVKRTISEKSRIPFWSRSSWLIAVTLIGTLLMDSSRRVAVTTISASASLVTEFSPELAQRPWVGSAASENVAIKRGRLRQKVGLFRAPIFCSPFSRLVVAAGCFRSVGSWRGRAPAHRCEERPFADRCFQHELDVLEFTLSVDLHPEVIRLLG